MSNCLLVDLASPLLTIMPEKSQAHNLIVYYDGFNLFIISPGVLILTLDALKEMNLWTLDFI